MTAVIRENLFEVLHSVDLPSWPCFMTDVHPEGMLGLPDTPVAFLTKPNPTKNVSYSLATQNSLNHNAAEQPINHLETSGISYFWRGFSHV